MASSSSSGVGCGGSAGSNLASAGFSGAAAAAFGGLGGAAAGSGASALTSGAGALCWSQRYAAALAEPAPRRKLPKTRAEEDAPMAKTLSR